MFFKSTMIGCYFSVLVITKMIEFILDVILVISTEFSYPNSGSHCPILSSCGNVIYWKQLWYSNNMFKIIGYFSMPVIIKRIEFILDMILDISIYYHITAGPIVITKSIVYSFSLLNQRINVIVRTFLLLSEICSHTFKASMKGLPNGIFIFRFTPRPGLKLLVCIPAFHWGCVNIFRILIIGFELIL